MSKWTYKRRRPDVEAVFWDGDNRDEVTQFLRDCGLPEDQGPYFSTLEDFQFDGYNTVKAGGCGGLEADMDRWILWDGEIFDVWTRDVFEFEFHVGAG